MPRVKHTRRHARTARRGADPYDTTDCGRPCTPESHAVVRDRMRELSADFAKLAECDNPTPQTAEDVTGMAKNDDADFASFVVHAGVRAAQHPSFGIPIHKQMVAEPMGTTLRDLVEKDENRCPPDVASDFTRNPFRNIEYVLEKESDNIDNIMKFYGDILPDAVTTYLAELRNDVFGEVMDAAIEDARKCTEPMSGDE